MSKFLITQSLLSSWKYQFSDFYDMYEDEENATEAVENARESFLSSLRRERIPTNAAMLRGRDFEDLVVHIAEGKTFKELMLIEADIENARIAAGTATKRRANTKSNWEKWYSGASAIAEIVRGGTFQVKLNNSLKIGNTEFLLHGRLDALKAGIIYDIKFASRYEYGNFIDSAQHPMYFALVPEAHTFTYLVFRQYEGAYEETYRREDTRDIADIITEFMDYLDVQGLTHLYHKHWLAL